MHVEVTEVLLFYLSVSDTVWPEILAGIIFGESML